MDMCVHASRVCGTCPDDCVPLGFGIDEGCVEVQL